MKAEGAGATADQRLLDILATLLRQGALPGELDNYSAEETREAAAFIAACAAKRQPGNALVKLESTGTGLGHRRMRIGIVNDDMPFLVDSVAQAIAARGGEADVDALMARHLDRAVADRAGHPARRGEE